MNNFTRLKWLAAVWIVAAAMSAACAAAQATAPADGQDTTSNAGQGAATAATPATGCSTIRTQASAGGASIVQDTGESLEHKSWQPVGGSVQFTVKSFVAIPANASVFACFRWKTSRNLTFIESPSRLDLSGDGKLLKVTTTVPYGLGPRPNDVAQALPLVPLTEVRLLAVDNQNAVKADVTTEIGITYPLAAFAFGIGVMIVGFVVLYAAASKRLTHPGILKANWLLRIISTPGGYASLSQLQIVLWTFVVAFSAVYVMSLSGQLIEITNGTLVLLGIAGATGIGAKIHTEAQGARAEAAASAAADDKNADAATLKAKADAMKNPPPDQTPKWSDLIVSESTRDDGTVTEIDVARFQMLLFTLITATFVLMNVVTTYVIPEISTGFQTLMGISNGVYLGAKVASRS